MTTTYDTLIGSRALDGSIKNWANDDRVPPKTILDEAEQWIYKLLRIRHMLTSTTGTLAAAADTVLLSDFTGYKTPFNFMFTPTATVVKAIPEFKTLDFVVRNWSYDGAGDRNTGRPRYWATDATNIQFDLKADQTYPFLFHYYRRLPALSPSNLSNVILSDYLSLMRYACLRFAAEHQKNQNMIKYYIAATVAEANSVNEESDISNMGVELSVDIGADEYSGY